MAPHRQRHAFAAEPDGAGREGVSYWDFGSRYNVLLMASLDWSVYMAKRRDWTGQVARCIALEEKIEAINAVQEAEIKDLRSQVAELRQMILERQDR